MRTDVDTPRGATQFGSLVVCLPYPHQGGQLRMAHQGQETICDWSAKKGEAIKWAAFYSDCEHEVLEVISGHRITLTYNLYGTCLPGLFFHKCAGRHLLEETNFRDSSTKTLRMRTSSRDNEADFTIICSS